MGSDRSNSKAKEQHACRTCGSPVSESDRSFPFCSERCRNVDLASWFRGDYKISREIKDSDLDTVD